MPLLKQKKNKKHKLSQNRIPNAVRGLATRKNKIKTRKKNKHTKLAGMLSLLTGQLSTRKCKTESSESGPSYEVCALCCEQMLPSQKTTMFMCNHRFHTEPCYLRLKISNHTSCPMCRKEIKLVGEEILKTNEQLERAISYTEKIKKKIKRGKVNFRDPSRKLIERDILNGPKIIDYYKTKLAKLIQFKKEQDEKVRNENQKITDELETLKELEKLKTLETKKSKKKSSQLYPSMLMPTGETAPDDGTRQKLN